MRFPLIVVGLILAAPLSAEPFRVVAATPAPDLDALFARTDGWAGADGNYSVPLGPGRALWFFSDTWVGQIRDGKRRRVTLVNNSIGVHTVVDGRASVELPLPEKPAATLRPEEAGTWYWPFGGVYDGGRVHQFLMQMRKAPGPEAFGFRTVAAWHGDIANPLDPPAQWRVVQRRLPFGDVDDERHTLFGAAVLTHGDHVYVYGTEDRPKDKAFGRRAIVARVPLGHIGDFDHWRFWDGTAWVADWKRATPIAAGAASEYSVTFVPALGQFALVCHAPMLSPKIVMRVAPQPWGPWSEPVTLYTCPEAAWKKGVFCYAGKAHGWLSADDELVVTYAANAFAMKDVLDDARLYWPRFVRVKVAKP